MPQTHSGTWDGRSVMSINGLGGVLTLADLGLDYLWTPADQGLVAWNFDPVLANNTVTAVSGTKYVFRIKVGQSCTVTNIVMCLPTAGSTLTAGQNGCALYDSTGAQLGATADQSGSWTSGGVKIMPITAPVAVNAGFVYVEVMSNGTTPATFTRATPSASAMNTNLAGATLRNATNGTGATALDASITPGSLSTANTPVAYWVGLS